MIDSLSGSFPLQLRKSRLLVAYVNVCIFKLPSHRNCLKWNTQSCSWLIVVSVEQRRLVNTGQRTAHNYSAVRLGVGVGAHLQLKHDLFAFVERVDVHATSSRAAVHATDANVDERCSRARDLLRRSTRVTPSGSCTSSMTSVPVDGPRLPNVIVNVTSSVEPAINSSVGGVTST